MHLLKKIKEKNLKKNIDCLEKHWLIRTFLPGDTGDRETRDGTLDDSRLAGHGSVVAHGSHMRQSVNIEPGRVMHLRDAVHRRAPVLTSVLHPHRAYVHMGYHVAVYRHVLAYHESASKSSLFY